MIGFWLVENKYGEFSNWYPCEIVIDGITFTCTEQAFMYYKAKLFNQTDIMACILASSDPKEQKRLGRTKFDNWDTKVFDSHKLQIMHDVNMAKYSQHEELKKLLLSTGDEVLCEASPYDKIWGIGMYSSSKDFNDPTKWRGENLLGNVLMKIREELRR